MDHSEAASLARDLMNQHGLGHWTFEWSRTTRVRGDCTYSLNRIRLSRQFVELNDVDQVRNTILHEIAHALTPGDGHGRKWKLACLRVGARPDRCASTGFTRIAYRAVCGHCGRVAGEWKNKPRMDLSTRLHSRCGLESKGKIVLEKVDYVRDLSAVD